MIFFSSCTISYYQSPVYLYRTGTIYEKLYWRNESKQIWAVLAIDNYNAYLQSNKYKKYRYKVYQNIACLYYHLNPEKNRRVIVENISNSIKENTENPDIYRLYGNINLYYEDYAASTNYFQKSILLDPSSEWTYLGLGYAYYQLGKTKFALLYYNKAKIINPQLKETIEEYRQD